MLTFNIRDVNYKPTLVATDEQTQPALHLYVVVVSSHLGVETRYVLATSPEQAGGMARCAAGIATYEVPEHIETLVKVTVTQVPLTIQGWGKSQF